MSPRDGLDVIKESIYWKARAGWADGLRRNLYSEFEAEIQHFEKWIAANIDTLDRDCAAIHNLAAEIGILDNMKLAERLYRIEQSIEEIKYTEPD